MDTCRNCGTEFNDNFCPNCGEKKFKRIVAKDVVNDFASNVLTFEGPILRTFKDLTLRPGTMVRSYLDGKRKTYARPVQYYLLGLSINLLFFFLYAEEMFKYVGENSMMAFDNPYMDAESADAYLEKQATMQTTFAQLFMVIQLPCYALFTWLFFLNTGRRFVEVLTGLLYQLGHLFYLSVITTLSYAVSPAGSLIAGLGISLVYLAWANINLFQQKAWIAILKTLAIYVCAMLTYAILAGIASAIIMGLTQ